VLLALLGACRSAGGEAGARFARAVPHAPRVADFDVLGYVIELELRPEEHAVVGACEVRFAALERPLERLRLDLVDLAVEDVLAPDGSALRYTHREGVLAIDLGRRLEPGEESRVRVRYGGQPSRGLWFAGQRADGSGPTLVFSHGQTEGSRGWFPCFDEPGERASSELVVTAPRDWTIVAAGERLEAREEGDRRTERWRLDFPHPAYLVDLVAGELVREEGLAGAVPLQFLADARLQEWIEPTFRETDEILAFLEEFTALPYPYSKYSQAAVENFPWGGMENISATTLTPLLLSDELGHADQEPFYLIAHEAAHQWFGDLFTCADWSQLWLNEGFATYLTLLYLEHSRGVDEFRAQLRETQEAYLSEDVGTNRRPIVWNVWKEPDDVFDTRPYQGAAVRLHLLRAWLGDERFREGVRAYARASVGRSVTTADFRAAMEASSGEDLGAFFEQWFRSPGFPEFAVAWSWDEQASKVLLAVDQLQDSLDGTPSVFAVPVQVEVRDSRGTRVHDLRIDERRERFSLPATERPLYVRFDNHGWIPKQVQEEKEAEEWLALATLAEDVNARREACLVLGRLIRVARERGRDAQPLLAALLERLGADESSWVRADAASALTEAAAEESVDALMRAALEDPAPRVRSAALLTLCAFGPDPGRASLAEDLFYAGPSYGVRGAAAQLLCYAAPERAFEFLASGVEQVTPHDVLAGLLLRQLGALQDPRALPELRRHAADPELAPTARAVAVQALGDQTRGRLDNARFLVPFLEDPSFHVRLAALRALGKFHDPFIRKSLREYYPRARTAAERRLVEDALQRMAP